MIVKIQDKTLEIQSPEPLISILRKLDIHFPLYCGNGQCGKCLVRAVQGKLPITEADEQRLSKQQLEDGFRLACQAMISEPCTIELTEMIKEREFFIPAPSMQQHSGKNVTDDESIVDGEATQWGIAIDIGTTTIAMALVFLNSGQIFRQYTGLNHQRSYGADVMARIRAAAEHKDNAEKLQYLIQRDIYEGLLNLVENFNEAIGQIAVAGNTTMLHLLRGYDSGGLGQYPFKPYTLEGEQLPVQELLGMNGMPDADAAGQRLPAAIENARVTIFPGISAFVGGDITAGLLACDFAGLKRPHLFLDLGTNAEMAVGCGEHILATSAAAGPAFEGGHLSCGIGSVPGAVRDVKVQYGFVRYETIGRKTPIGICGTGIVACMSEMLKNRYMDADGLLRPKYASGFQIVPGKVAVTQADIREFQKAKGAIRAGLDLLMSEGGYKVEDIEAIDLAGGFGCQLDVEHAIRIGLMPKVLADKVRQRGNTVISGLIRYMRAPDMASVQLMAENVKEFSLANQPEFMEKYLDFMRFSTEI